MFIPSSYLCSVTLGFGHFRGVSGVRYQRYNTYRGLFLDVVPNRLTILTTLQDESKAMVLLQNYVRASLSIV